MSASSIPAVEERQLITREFAQSLVGKTPHPYLRIEKDRVLAALASAVSNPNSAETSIYLYLERMIHFWREVSVAGMPRTGRGADECNALLFEAAFDCALQHGQWAETALQFAHNVDITRVLRELAHQVPAGAVSHVSLTSAMQRIHAPLRERNADWTNPMFVALNGEVWFWSAVQCATQPLTAFDSAVHEAAAARWQDRQLHTELIRGAPRKAENTPGNALMAHPLLRIARLKYANGSAEGAAVLRFLNARAIEQGFESEDDCFDNPLVLAQWVRDARRWAENTPGALRDAITAEQGAYRVHVIRRFYRKHVGTDPNAVDSIDATERLMRWARSARGYEASEYPAQAWEFIVEVVDAALWLGWTFPRKSRRRSKGSTQGNQQ